MTVDTNHSAAIAALSRAALLEVFDEQDPARRVAAIARIFSEDICFVDHNGTHVGRSAIAEAVEQLHAKLPGFRFTIARGPELIASAARLQWKFGPASDPAKVTGSDTILVRDGRISVLLVFLEETPQ